MAIVSVKGTPVMEMVNPDGSFILVAVFPDTVRITVVTDNAQASGIVSFLDGQNLLQIAITIRPGDPALEITIENSNPMDKNQSKEVFPEATEESFDPMDNFDPTENESERKPEKNNGGKQTQPEDELDLQEMSSQDPNGGPQPPYEVSSNPSNQEAPDSVVVGSDPPDGEGPGPDTSSVSNGTSGGSQENQELGDEDDGPSIQSNSSGAVSGQSGAGEHTGGGFSHSL